MKKYSLLLLIAGFVFTASCNKDFLDKAPAVDITEENVFQSRANLDRFIATIYKYAVHSVFRYRDQNLFSTTGTVSATDVIHPSASACDEGDASEAGFVNNNVWNNGAVTPGNIINVEDYRYYIRWIAIRQINLVIKRINEVPDAPSEYKKQVIDEVKFLRALNYFEMFKRYGGVPLVDSIFEALAPVNVPRSSLEQTLNFILKDLNEVISHANTPEGLPAAQTAALKGRANVVAAFALKAKVLLFAASPLYNRAAPLISMDDPANNKLVCFGNYDINRWKLAADAATEAINFINSNSASYSLIDNRDSVLISGRWVQIYRKPIIPAINTPGTPGNYRNSWEQYNNPEIIFGYQGNNLSNISNAPLTFWTPKVYGAFWSGISVTLNHVRKYEDTLGNTVNWTGSGTDLITKYNALDPRFRQSINYTTSYFSPTYPVSNIYTGGTHGIGNNTGNWLRKYIPGNAAGGGSVFLNDVLFRVNELYLHRAEALNEFSGPTTAAYRDIDTIRVRTGMPRLPLGLSQNQFRLRMRNEKAVELLLDDHRFWDVRRWIIAQEEGVMTGKMEGLQIAAPVAGKYAWTVYTFETRVFNQNMYFHPFPQAEFLKGNLVQNPGWQ